MVHILDPTDKNIKLLLYLKCTDKGALYYAIYRYTSILQVLVPTDLQNIPIISLYKPVCLNGEFGVTYLMISH